MMPPSNKSVDCPRVTIVIPVYNGANFLREAIDSALSQTYPDIEIVVVNDGSQDGGATEQIALSYGQRIRYFAKSNGGVASALNVAIANMSGAYFSWLSHDDLYTVDKVEKEVAAVVRIGRNNTVIYSDYAVFTDRPDDAVARRLKYVEPSSFRYWLTTEGGLHGCTLLIPRCAFEKIGGFDEGLRTTQDMDLWFRMAQEFTFVHIPVVLVKSRFHEAQGSRVLSLIARVECNDLFSKFIEDLTLQEILLATGGSKAYSYGKIASRMFSLGLNQAANLAERFARQGERNRRASMLRSVGYLKNRLVYIIRKMIPAAVLVNVKVLVLHLRSSKFN